MQKNADFAAVVWDMDGMLFDTERLSFIAWRHGASELGLTIDEAIFMSLIGMNSKNIKLSLQESLGHLNDVAVAEHLLAELTQAAGRGKAAAQGQQAAGQMIGWYDRALLDFEPDMRRTWKSFAASTPFWDTPKNKKD